MDHWPFQSASQPIPFGPPLTSPPRSLFRHKLLSPLHSPQTTIPGSRQKVGLFNQLACDLGKQRTHVVVQVVDTLQTSWTPLLLDTPELPSITDVIESTRPSPQDGAEDSPPPSVSKETLRIVLQCRVSGVAVALPEVTRCSRHHPP